MSKNATPSDNSDGHDESIDHDSQTNSDDSVGTPAAHIQTQAPCQEVRQEITTVEGLVRVQLRSDDITAMLLYEAAEAEALADQLATSAAEAREQREVNDADQ
jgi:hypothetical protein